MNISVAISAAFDYPAAKRSRWDIAAIMPEGWQWGTEEVKLFLILEVALPIQATLEQAQALMARYYAGGVLTWDDAPPETIAHRRFGVDINALKTIISGLGIVVDWDRVQDPSVAYQPLSPQVGAPGGTRVLLDPTKIAFDKYENRLVRAADFHDFITGQ